MSAQARLPKFHRAPEAFTGRRITDRGIEIICIILRYRFISTSTMVKVVGGNEDVTYRHLQLLYHQGLVSRFTFPRQGNPGEFIYFLENAAALREIAHRLAGTEIDWAQIKGNREKYADMRVTEIGDGFGKFLFIRHELMISDFHAALEVGSRTSGGRVALCRWMQGSALWSRVKMPSRQTFPHRPDALFTLRFPSAPEGQQRSNFFYEADRGTTNLTRFKQKLEAHLEYLKQGKQAALGIKRVRAVLVETISAERCEQCMEVASGISTNEQNIAGLFWFSIQGQLNGAGLEPRWATSTDALLRSLAD